MIYGPGMETFWYGMRHSVTWFSKEKIYEGAEVVLPVTSYQLPKNLETVKEKKKLELYLWLLSTHIGDPFHKYYISLHQTDPHVKWC